MYNHSVSERIKGLENKVEQLMWDFSCLTTNKELSYTPIQIRNFYNEINEYKREVELLTQSLNNHIQTEVHTLRQKIRRRLLNFIYNLVNKL